MTTILWAARIIINSAQVITLIREPIIVGAAMDGSLVPVIAHLHFDANASKKIKNVHGAIPIIKINKNIRSIL